MDQTTDMHDSTADQGFTVVELAMVASLLSVIIAIAFLLFNSTVGMSDRIMTRSIVAEEARGAVDLMTRELRQGQEIVTGNGVFATAQPRQCSFYMDINRDYVPERISYFMNGVRLVRTQASATTSVPPFSFGTDGPQRTLVSTISPSFTDPIFTYLDTSGVVLTSSQSARCSAVGLHVVASAPVPGTLSESVTVDLSTWVKVRSVFNSIQ
jgi:prepilin-type N-terminal cleavage/methylation domain-containing protein